MTDQSDQRDCAACDEPNSVDDMVACDSCNKWYHYRCANVGSEISQRDWTCNSCQDEQPDDTIVTHSTLVEPKHPSRQGKVIKPSSSPIRQSTPTNQQNITEAQTASATTVTPTVATATSVPPTPYFNFMTTATSPFHNIPSTYSPYHPHQFPLALPPPYLAYQPHQPYYTSNIQQHASFPHAENKPFESPHVSNTNPVKATTHLTSEQIQARQLLKDLPTFSGQPEEWPIFITSFNTSTAECRYTDAENMVRLQKSLKGEAFTRVKGKLHIPSEVPKVIEILKILYGRPEVILTNLVEKVRKTPAPNETDFKTFSNYAFVVQDVCDAAKASGLNYYLQNPILLQEFVDRLPISHKYQWAMYQANIPNADLSVFGDWIFNAAIALDRVTVLSCERSRSKQHHQKTTYKGRINTHSEISKCIICAGTCKNIADCGIFKNLSRNDKWKIVRNNAICGKCLEVHSYSTCNTAKECGIGGCKSLHHPLMHNEVYKNYRDNNKIAFNSKNHAERNRIKNKEICNTHRTSDTVLFRMVPVKLYNGNKSVETFALLDEGSSVTLIDKNLADDLKIRGTPESLCLKWTTSEVREDKHSEKINFDISGNYENAKRFRIKGAHTVTTLDLPRQSLDITELKKSYPYLRRAPVESYKNVTARILIGIDNNNLILPQSHIENSSSKLVATKCRLGWAVHGAEKVDSIQNTGLNFHICECRDQLNSLENTMKEFYSTESFGVKVPESLPTSKENKRAIDILQKTTRDCNGKYEAGLLWRFDNLKIPDSYAMAEKRLECIERRMARDPALKQKMNEQIQDYVVKGYARELSANEIETENPVWYLPIFPVLNPNKPGKFRIVLDAAAAVKGISLNSMLLPGPDLVEPLINVLFKFRENCIAVTGDIKEMFHRISIKRNDQDAQRFLWRFGESNKTPKIFIMTAMIFGATCSPCIAQYVKNLNAENWSKKYPRASHAIKKNHYVDDLLVSVETPEEAVQLVNEIIHVHKQANFELRNFNSNCAFVLKEIAPEDETRMKAINVHSEDKIEKVLGLWWETEKDQFTYTLSYNRNDPDLFLCRRMPTKREALKLIMSIYDPFGFLSPLMINGKILLKLTWQMKVEWDEQIPKSIESNWCTLMYNLQNINEIKIPRHYFGGLSNKNKILQLHLFCDASESAFAAVAYLRTFDPVTNEVNCSFISSKTRIAPQKMLSVPRLELQAALLGARLSKSIGEGHNIKFHKKFFWCDSTTVLHWLRNGGDRKFRQFVAYRIGEILELSSTSEWRYISSAKNVADLATRSNNLSPAEINDTWLKGPSFLNMSEEMWPSDIESKKELPADVRVEEIKNVHASFAIQKESLYDSARCSKWSKLVKIYAYILRFISNCRRRPITREVGVLSSEELRAAEECIYREIQQREYPREFKGFMNNKNYQVDKNSKLFQHSPYMDDNGIIRIRGRIDAAPFISESTKRPIILPKNDYITFLIVAWYHEKYRHMYNETVVNEVRQKYFISKLRVLVRKVKRNCQSCKINNSNPIPPQMAPLPPSRLASFVRPFSYVGIDYFGPIMVSVGRRTEKRWGVLFTCLTVRAIHIEIAHSLSADSCVMAIRNFTARRGEPLEYFSDNGTNFHGAKKELENEFGKIDSKQIAETIMTPTVKWNFNPPSCPHMGGAWERLIGSVKRVLYAVVPTRNLNDELLRCIMMEAEEIVNSRPLTYIPLEADNDEAITPNHFLLGSSSGRKPVPEFPAQTVLLRKNWKTAQYIADQFWKRFVREYLPILTRRTKWYGISDPVKIGDLVIIVDENRPRNQWLKGRVLETYPGKDGVIRQALIQTCNGLLRRPMVKLAILDVRGKEDSLYGPGDVEEQAEDNQIKSGDSLGPDGQEIPRKEEEERKEEERRGRKCHSFCVRHRD